MYDLSSTVVLSYSNKSKCQIRAELQATSEKMKLKTMVHRCQSCLIVILGVNRGGLLVNGDIANSGVLAGADPILTNITRPAIPPINLHVPKNVLIGPSDTSDAQGRHSHGWVAGLTPRLILNCKLGVGDPQRDLSVLAADGGTTLYTDAEINALPTPPSGQSDDILLRYGQSGQVLTSQGYDLPPKWTAAQLLSASCSLTNTTPAGTGSFPSSSARSTPTTRTRSAARKSTTSWRFWPTSTTRRRWKPRWSA